MDSGDAFLQFASELADGERWKVLQAEDWEAFQERLAEVVGDLPIRRRQALIMLLYGMVEGIVSPPEVAEWMEGHDVSSDDGVEALIEWLRSLRSERR